MNNRTRLAALAALLALTASAGTAGGLVVDPEDRFLARAFYNSAYGASEGIPVAWTGNLATCTAGSTGSTFRDAVLTRINYFRAMAGVPADVAFRTDYNAMAQAAALIMSANADLSHYPPQSWKCWSQGGYDAAGSSNLSLGSYGPDAVASQMRDNGANNKAVGHRRWILYPQTEVMGSGSVPETNTAPAAQALWVVDGHYHNPRPATREAFVAWPPPGFVPYQVVYPRWSFSYPGADFVSATVTMKRDGAPIAVATEPLVGGVGENTLVWVPEGKDANAGESGWTAPAADITYEIDVANVRIGGQARNFSYRVVVIDPARAGSGEVDPTVAGPVQIQVGQSDTYDFPAVPHAIGYELGTLGLAAYTEVEGAEPGTLAAIIDGTDADYPLASTGVRATGTASFHLAHPNARSQFFAIGDRFLVGPNASLRCKTRLGWATPDQVAKAEISLDEGRSWQDLYAQAGTNSAGESGFSNRTMSLSAFAGRVASLRFVYQFDVGRYYPQTDNGVGFYVDDIEVTGVERVDTEALRAIGNTTRFAATAAASGRIGYRIRPKLWDRLPALDWGPVTAVQATSSPPTPTTDTDGDGMPDGWELAHGLNPNVRDGSLDADRDGASNLIEYQGGTGPRDPGDIPPWVLMPARGGWRAILH